MRPHLIWLSLGLIGGTTLLDSRYADYQWNVDPHATLGAVARIGRGRLATGLRLTQSRSTQAVGVPDPGSAVGVRTTRLEWLGEARLARVAGFDLHAALTAGRVHLGYHPDRVDFTAGGTPVTAEFAPIDAWIGGGGLGVRRRLAGPWQAGVSVDRSIFSMDTAHRSGASIVTERQSFGDWNARLELSWRLLGS